VAGLDPAKQSPDGYAIGRRHNHRMNYSLHPSRQIVYTSRPMSNPQPPSAPKPSAPSVIERFTLYINALCKAVVEPKLGGLMIGPLTGRVWSKLQRFSADWAEFAAQVRAGTLPERPARRPRRPRAPAAPPRPKRPAPPPPPWAALVPPRPPLPRGFGWLLKFAPVSCQYRGQLLHLLAQPETQELIAANPDEARRLLNPLLRMLGIRFLKLPPSPQQDPAASRPPPRRRLLLDSIFPACCPKDPPNRPGRAWTSAAAAAAPNPKLIHPFQPGPGVSDRCNCAAPAHALNVPNTKLHAVRRISSG
jgi:hypothetical protein